MEDIFGERLDLDLATNIVPKMAWKKAQGFWSIWYKGYSVGEVVDSGRGVYISYGPITDDGESWRMEDLGESKTLREAKRKVEQFLRDTREWRHIND